MYAKVIVDLRIKNVNKLYHYYIPARYQKRLKPGMRVVVDFNNQKRMAYVIEIITSSQEANKEILYLLDKTPILTNKQLNLSYLLAENSFQTIAHALKEMLPSKLLVSYQKVLEVIKEEQLDLYYKNLIRNGYLKLSEIDADKIFEVEELIKKRILKPIKKPTSKDSYKKIKLLSIKNENVKTVKQKEIIKRLKEPTLYRTLRAENYSQNIIKRLISQDFIKVELIRDTIENNLLYNIKNKDIILNNTQKNAIDKVSFKASKRYLLTGKAASGKTIVYLEMVKKALNFSKQVLLIVPDKTLIPLVSAKIKNIFNDNFRIYSSEISENKKLVIYDEVKNNEIKIVVGTKKALFLPFKNLGLIVIDDAHDDNYLQKVLPYYHLKELAFELSKMFKCPLVFVTATPSVEMNYQTQLGMIELLKLSDLRLHKPEIKLIDMKEELFKGNSSILSLELIENIKKVLKKEEQALILVNKSGYAPFVMCRSCGSIEGCPHCGKALRYYKDKNILRCHGCNYKKAYSEICSNCNQPKNKEIGYGIEQAYEVLKNTFKSARIVVLESSRITKRGSYEKILNDFKDGKIDILLGTQILSKAFNFENVSLVAILLADQMLKIRSYLANEKTYQLYSQTIGSLRGKIKTKALIQTYDKKHFVLNALKNEDNIMFYEEELKLRKRLNYPPFSKMAKLTLRGTDEINTFQRLHSIKHHLIKSNTQLEIIGPSEDYFKFKDNYYYFEIIIKAPLRYDIMALLKYLNEKHHKDNILINLYDDSL